MARKKKTAAQLAPVKQDFQSPLSPTGKERPPPPSIIIPPTPSPSNGPSSLDQTRHEAWSTPPISARTPPPRYKLELPPVSDAWQPQGEDMTLSASSIASPELLALANFQASIKQALANLSSTMDQLEVQSSRMHKLGEDIKIRDQIELLRTEVEEQISRQKADLEKVEKTLAAKVKDALKEHIKAKLRASLKETISATVRVKVQEELTAQIPDKLREGLLGHQRQIDEVKASIHNSEARRYNASLQSASLNVPLRPLLRPLPTPEQSPYPVLATTSVPNSRLPSALPLSAYPYPPAPTPISIRRSTSGFAASCGAISRSHSFQHMAPTPSTLFPKDLKSLFALGPDATKTLLKEYGLESTLPSPAVEEAKLLKAPKMQRRVSSTKAAASQPSIPEESDVDEEQEEIVAHVQDMNTFMAHIGVPFLMVPPPKHKETNAERRKKLAPLIINAAPGPIR